MVKFKLFFNLLHFQEMTMIRRWSKPKSYSGEETPQPPGGLGDLISKCITRDAAVSVIVPSPNPNQKTASTEVPQCASVGPFSRWLRARGRCWGWGVERERVEHGDWDARNWTVLAGLSGRLWCHHLLSCAQGEHTAAVLRLYLPSSLFFGPNPQCSVCI